MFDVTGILKFSVEFPEFITEGEMVYADVVLEPDLNMETQKMILKATITMGGKTSEESPKIIEYTLSYDIGSYLAEHNTTITMQTGEQFTTIRSGTLSE